MASSIRGAALVLMLVALFSSARGARWESLPARILPPNRRHLPWQAFCPTNAAGAACAKAWRPATPLQPPQKTLTHHTTTTHTHNQTKQAQTVPSASDCASKVSALGGDTAVLQRLQACSGGPTGSCCSAATGLFKSGDLAYCLCNAAVLSASLSAVESNVLARAAGVTRASTTAV